MGGTFNPIHNAHLAMARAAHEQADLDEVWFMPSKNPPHKSHRELVSEFHRSRMICLAIEDVSGFVFSDYELLRPGTTYTAHTLTELSKEYPEDAFSFIMGGDSFFELEQWYHPEIVMKYASLLVFSRDGMNAKKMKQRAGELMQRYDADIFLLQMPASSISSRQIRQKRKERSSIHGMLPQRVEEYIADNHLYL
jgi:nicotinate-nucleotide adenylyltransferase